MAIDGSARPERGISWVWLDLVCRRRLALLNSILASSLAHGGRSYGGGLQKVEPSELANILLPTVPEWAHAREEAQLVLL